MKIEENDFIWKRNMDGLFVKRSFLNFFSIAKLRPFSEVFGFMIAVVETPFLRK